MNILGLRVLAAGNVYSRRPVVEMVLSLEGDPNTLFPPDIAMRILESLPPLRDDMLDFRGWQRLGEAIAPVPAAAVVEVLAVLIQRFVNWPVGFCGAQNGAKMDGTRSVFEIGSRGPGMRAARAAVDLVNALLAELSPTQLHACFVDQIGRYARKTTRETPPMDALAVAREAGRCAIPWSLLPQSRYLRLGMGRYANILFGSESTHTSAIGKALARRKHVSGEMLAAAGLPVPKHRAARNVEAALVAAQAIGFPLVVKPASGNQGRGVSIGVRDEAELIKAFERAQQVSPAYPVILQALIPGDDYRLLVIQGEFVAAARRRPAQVRGDGRNTIRELIDQENLRPERNAIVPSRMSPLDPITVDEEGLELLAEQGWTPDSVPGAGEAVRLSRMASISSGGDTVDVTDQVHQSIRDLAVRTAILLDIDVCGIDFITTDISRPYRETDGAICEANNQPGLSLHHFVSGGTVRNVARDVVRMLYPRGAPSHVPIVAMLEEAGGHNLQRAIEEAAASVGKCLGVLSHDTGADVHEATSRAATRSLKRVSDLDWEKAIEAAIIVIPARKVVKQGLGLRQLDLAVLPSRSDSRTVSLAGAALARAARNSVITPESPEALRRALTALGLLPKPAAARSSTQTLNIQPVVSTHIPATDHGTAFTVLLVGDIGFGESYTHYKGTADIQHLLTVHGHVHSLARMKGLLSSADLIIGNLEVPLARHPDPSLRGRKKYLGWSDADGTIAALKDAHIAGVSLANNHTLDCGVSGLLETIDRLSHAGIASFGAGIDLAAAERPFVRRFSVGPVERTLVVFGAFEHRQRYEDKYRWYAKKASIGVNMLSPARIAAIIAALRDTQPWPIFVAYLHWGVDYSSVTSNQRDLAAQLMDGGVDLIIGHGTHSAQPIETIAGRPVAFGLGNFVWNTPGRYREHHAPPYGLAASLRFRYARDRSETYLRLYPIVTDNKLTQFQNRPVTKQEFIAATGTLLSGSRPGLQCRSDEIGYYLELEVDEHVGPPLAGSTQIGEPAEFHAAAMPEAII